MSQPGTKSRGCMRRHIQVLKIAEEYAQPFTCDELAVYSGYDTKLITASLQFLKKSGAMKIVGKSNRSGNHALWEPTGEQIDRNKVKQIHANKPKEEKPAYITTVNNMDKPASYWRTDSNGQGESVRRGFTSLAMVGY